MQQDYTGFVAHALVQNGALFVIPNESGKIDLTPEYRQLAQTKLPQFLN
jgi:hypothetical protein